MEGMSFSERNISLFQTKGFVCFPLLHVGDEYVGGESRCLGSLTARTTCACAGCAGCSKVPEERSCPRPLDPAASPPVRDVGMNPALVCPRSASAAPGSGPADFNKTRGKQGNGGTQGLVLETHSCT